MKRNRLRLALTGLLLLLFVLGAWGSSQSESTEWPSQTITLIYHSGAGSGGDLFLRALAKPLEKDLGVSVIVDNKPGAGGMNAWKPAAEAKDGHTFLGVSSTLITAPILNKMPIDYRSFSPVAMMFVDAMIFFVSADKPWNTIDDFIADAKANPGKYNIAGGVPGELGFVAGKLLMDEAGVDYNIVPFEAGSDAAVSVLGGHIDGAIGEYAEASAQIEVGELKVLVGFNPVPGTNIPTVQDEGLNIQIEKFRGIVAPKDTPPAVIDRLVAACKAAMDDPTFKTYYQNMKLMPAFKPKEEFTKVMEAQDAQIRSYMK